MGVLIFEKRENRRPAFFVRASCHHSSGFIKKKRLPTGAFHEFTFDLDFRPLRDYLEERLSSDHPIHSNLSFHNPPFGYRSRCDAKLRKGSFEWNMSGF
jgi:hypothetical protein